MDFLLFTVGEAGENTDCFTAIHGGNSKWAFEGKMCGRVRILPREKSCYDRKSCGLGSNICGSVFFPCQFIPHWFSLEFSSSFP